MIELYSKEGILLREKEFSLFEKTINKELRKAHYRIAGKKATETGSIYTSGCKGYGAPEVLMEILSDYRKERITGEIVDKVKFVWEAPHKYRPFLRVPGDQNSKFEWDSHHKNIQLKLSSNIHTNVYYLMHFEKI